MKAGVSRSAVSRTFTPGASVSDETRLRVLRAAEDLGYHVNHLARGLTRRESGIVCMIVSDLATPYRSNLLRALTDQLQNAGRVAMLINTDRSDGSVNRALQQAVRYRADASVILSGMPDKSIIDLCLRSGQRLVLINRDEQQEGLLRINLDDAAAADTAARAFLRAGCHLVAFATSGAGTPSLVAREQGFLEAAKELGLQVIVERQGVTGYQCGRTIAQSLMTRRQRPQAVFCATDLIACGLMDAVRQEFGLSIPKDLCVIGFDDIEQASWSAYSLTTFAQPVDEIALQAVEWLSLPEGSAFAREPLVKLHANIVWRQTVRGG
ncbi:LacI family transcriptional regulator [Pseudorhizobium endolithicum]|uniref:LacI family transcriptional regulator n=1 Tax=Pseudorhizobium endolithicum TaxID=1191678 RepID=A0ABN7JYJ5_9HYPH|nr:LacI family transcriptional regulator [Rhizobium sp. Q54]CAD7054228.1 LacI family transcriptional regulator [Pseudorhizobium endolithicum]